MGSLGASRATGLIGGAAIGISSISNAIAWTAMAAARAAMRPLSMRVSEPWGSARTMIHLLRAVNGTTLGREEWGCNVLAPQVQTVLPRTLAARGEGFDLGRSPGWPAANENGAPEGAVWVVA